MTQLRVVIFLILCSFLLASPSSLAQVRCSTVEYEKMLHLKNPKLETEQQFEQWIQGKIAEKRLKGFGGVVIQSVYTIPVVVHVIHNGESIGTGLNISDAQIASQIKVLNDDYNRMNADKTNTPIEFQPFAGNISIQFVLAQQDPDGQATNGITRTLGTKTSWTLAESTEFKALSYWPAENYMNLWVVKFSDNYIGFAQLPESSLPGLENSSTDRLTDGVSIDYQAFGSSNNGSFDLLPLYNKGRTATHEVGHFFGLRHIWGDGNCATDYVADTPTQPANTNACPTHPQSVICQDGTHNKMFQNFLDYSGDACMNLFTQGQVDRMVIILQNSPRRLSLLSSPGASPPLPVPNDLGVRSIPSPTATTCVSPVTPTLEIRNYGNNVVTSAQIQVSVNGSVVETKSFSSLSISPNQSINVSFNALSFTDGTSQQVSFNILQTNGTTDGKPVNNTAAVQVVVPITTAVPFTEPFNSLPSGWQVVNPDGSITWTNRTAPDNSPSNKAMFMNFYDYESEGTLDWLLTPSFSLPTPLTSQLRFDISYAQYPGISSDNLKVYALPGCNPDLSQGILLYSKSGSELATSSTTPDSYVPSSNAQWRKSEVLSLNTLTGSTNWQLAFIGRNGFGNNLYLDNVQVNDQATNDIAIVGIVSPGLVHCKPNPNVVFNVKNLSTGSLTSFQVQITIGGGAPVTQTFSNILINVGEQKNFTLNAVTLNKGINQLSLTLVNPNGLADTFPSNNSISFTSYLDNTADSSPLRITFDNSSEIPWLAASVNGARTWESVNTNKKSSRIYNALSNPNFGEEGWLVSPILDLSKSASQSLFFDLSYYRNPPGNDHLKVLGSDDCGVTYNTILFDKGGSEFAISTLPQNIIPATNADWNRQFVNLEALSGKKDVRLAFVATNANGNNIYIDNLEVFLGDDPQPPVTSALYQLYYSSKNTQSNIALTFKFPVKQDVQLQIFNVMGQLVADNTLPDVLNQTYYFDLSLQASGLYLFRLQTDNQVSTTKVYIGH